MNKIDGHAWNTLNLRTQSQKKNKFPRKSKYFSFFSPSFVVEGRWPIMSSFAQTVFTNSDLLIKNQVISVSRQLYVLYVHPIIVLPTSHIVLRSDLSYKYCIKISNKKIFPLVLQYTKTDNKRSFFKYYFAVQFSSHYPNPI